MTRIPGIERAADDDSSAARSAVDARTPEPSTGELPMSDASTGELPLLDALVGPGPAESHWRTVVEASRRPPNADAPIQLKRVLLQLLAAVVVVVALVAVAGAIVSRRSAESEAVHQAAGLADVLATSVMQPSLTARNAADPTTIPATVDAVVRARILSTSVARVKLWTPEGRIVYSDEPRLIGRTFTLDDGAREVLASPQTRAEVSNLNAPENVYERSQGKLLEVYRPVWLTNGQPLLFETYFRYNVVSERSSQLWRGFAGITLSSILAVFALLLPLVWTLVARARRAQAQREEMMQRALDASQEERRRIAAGLHDGVVQQLVAASFEVGGGAEVAQARGDAELAGRLRAAAGTVRTGIGGLRTLLVDIYPPTLHDAGVGSALRDLASTFAGSGTGSGAGGRTEIEIAVDEEAANALAPAQREAFFRIAQEAVRNAVRHADATLITVTIEREADKHADRVRMTVADNGIGLADTDDVTSPAGHFGLSLMRDVAVGAGASLEVASQPRGGTAWRAEVFA